MTTFIIGIIVSATLMAAFGIVLSSSNEQYPTTNYQESDLAAFEKMQDIHNLTTQIKDRVENQSTDRNLADVIGGFIADGKDTLLLSAKSYGLLESMADEGMTKVQLPEIFRISLYSILLVILFIGIILAAILGRVL